MERLSDLHRDWLHAQLLAHRWPSPANVRRANRALGRLVVGLWRRGGLGTASPTFPR